MRFCTSCICIVLGIASAALGRSHSSGDEVAFRLYHNYLIVVHGALGPLNNLNFVIDTGTNPSIVDRRVADRLGLTGRAETIRTVSGEFKSVGVETPAIRIGPVNRSAVHMGVQDLRFLKAEVGLRVDALIGLDVLGQSSFLIDYDHKRIRFGPAATGTEAVPFAGDPPFVTVDLRVNDRSVRMLVDTGTANLILFENHPANPVVLGSGTDTTPSSSVGGRFNMRAVPIARSMLGSQDLGARQAFLAVDSGNQSQFDGLMGISAARVRRITFDFDRRLFSLQAQNSRIPPITEAEPARCDPAAAPPGTMSWSVAGGEPLAACPAMSIQHGRMR